MIKESRDRMIQLGGKIPVLASPVFEAANRNVETQFIAFLQGTSTKPADYACDNWLPSTTGQFDMSILLRCLGRGCSSEILDKGRKLSLRHKRSYIPNVAARVQLSDQTVWAVKLGHIDALQANFEALRFLAENGIITTHPQVYRFQNSRVGMMVSPFVDGEKPNDYSALLEYMTTLTKAQLTMWYKSVDGISPRHKLVGTLAFDVVPHNIKVSQTYGPVCFDADLLRCWGKHIKTGEVTGEVSELLHLQLDECGIDPSNIGLRYVPKSYSLQYPAEWLAL